jgi:hypothetical protein
LRQETTQRKTPQKLRGFLISFVQAYSLQRLKISEPFVPPKPKLLLSA